jgi:hypothetical protein
MAKTEPINIDIRPHISAVARPGDTVLIGFAHELSDEEVEAMDEHFRPLLDQGIKVGFLDQVTSMVVVKGE